MIRIGIIGYGNLGRGVECVLSSIPDAELVAVFTRRSVDSIQLKSENVPVVSLKEIANYKDKIDVMILCGGSATDLPEQTPEIAKMFNVIDSFDTHAKIPEHFANVNASALSAGKIAMISVGWDPGLFSLNRVYAESILPEGKTYTFWGKGVSQGHSDALRRIPGVKNAKQYTIPLEKALEAVRSGANPELSTREKHLRECFVVLEENADAQKIENEIKTMPNYFADYDTIVHFIDEEDFLKNHSGMAHGGFVIRSGNIGYEKEFKNIVEYNIKLDSNPMFTASVLVAYARAAYRMFKEGFKGAKTVFDVPPAYLSPKSAEDLRKEYL